MTGTDKTPSRKKGVKAGAEKPLLDVYETWLKTQQVKQAEVSTKKTRLPSDSYENWMQKQVKKQLKAT